MTKYRVELDREGCIGAAACVAVDPENWVMANDGKVDMIDCKKDSKSGFFYKIIEESELAKWKESAESCPVLVIRIFDLTTNKQVI